MKQNHLQMKIKNISKNQYIRNTDYKARIIFEVIAYFSVVHYILSAHIIIPPDLKPD